VFENRWYDKGTDLRPFLQSIEWIEERAGFDFFPDSKQKKGLDPSSLRGSRALDLWP
jgi:hypothetical protein